MKLSREELLPAIKRASEVNGVKEDLIFAVILTESSCDTHAIRYEDHYKWLVSPNLFAKSNQITEETETLLQKCSIGLMQIMGAVARELGFKQNLLQLTDPFIGIQMGTKKLKTLINKYNTIDDVLASYNAGSPRKLENGLYVNQVYVDKVRQFLNKKVV